MTPAPDAAVLQFQPEIGVTRRFCRGQAQWQAERLSVPGYGHRFAEALPVLLPALAQGSGDIGAADYRRPQGPQYRQQRVGCRQARATGGIAIDEFDTVQPGKPVQQTERYPCRHGKLFSCVRGDLK
jgi:hypothetical protein